MKKVLLCWTIKVQVSPKSQLKEFYSNGLHNTAIVVSDHPNQIIGNAGVCNNHGIACSKALKSLPYHFDVKISKSKSL
jgi:hypothetical protein